MTEPETDTLVSIVEQNDKIATEAPVALAELDTQRNLDADTVVSVVSAALSKAVRDAECLERVTERLPELFVKYPELRTEALEPLCRMAVHDDPTVREQGIRSLGFLGARGTDEREIAVETIAQALQIAHPATQQVALWSLTKIGLADPDAITPHRDQLVRFVDESHSGFGLATTARRQRYAFEALSVNASGSIAVDDYRPRGPPSEHMSSFAAWALQRTIAQQELEVDSERQIRKTTSLDEGHNVVTTLVPTLKSELRDENSSEIATGLVFALGCLLPRHDELWDDVSSLNALIDQDSANNQRLAEAVQRTLREDRSISAGRPMDNPPRDREFELTVESVEDLDYFKWNPVEDLEWDQNYESVGVPRAVAETFFTSPQNDEATVEIIGNSSVETSIGSLRSEDCLRTTRVLREKLDVDVGDTVTIRPASTEFASKVVLAIPNSISADHLTEYSVKKELTGHRYTVGEYLPLNVLPETEVQDSKLMSMPEGAYNLPIRVESIHPGSANRITTHTEIVVEQLDSAQKAPWFQMDESSLDESVVPTALCDVHLLDQ